MNRRLELAALASASSLSHDPRTHNAARLIHPDYGVYSKVAYNAIPSRLAVSDRRLTPAGKPIYVEHAERAVIYRAAANGFDVFGCEMLALWASCPECARAIIASGVAAVHTCKATHDATPPRWRRAVDQGLDMLREAGVPVEFHADLGVTILFNGSELAL